VLQAISQMSRRVRRLILMAGAVSDHCLTQEFASVQAKVDVISALASKKDEVLRWLSYRRPGGRDSRSRSSLVGVGAGTLWTHSKSGALSESMPDSKGWDFGHGNYLQVDSPPHEPIPSPEDVPPRVRHRQALTTLTANPSKAGRRPGLHRSFPLASPELRSSFSVAK